MELISYIKYPTKCKQCKVTLKYMGSGCYICPSCEQIYKDDFCKVKEYLYEHPHATVVVVSEDTGVAVPIITKLLREGRLEIPEGSPIYIPCEKCGTDIRYGKYCRECAHKLSKDFKAVLISESEIGEPPKHKTGEGKMHYLTKDK